MLMSTKYKVQACKVCLFQMRSVLITLVVLSLGAMPVAQKRK